MHVLALDTTTRDGSVALVNERGVVEERPGDRSRTHAERLPGELLEVASAHGVAVRDIDLYAVASGPGSFTGLRIGIATVQGLALATNRSVVSVSALEALAAHTAWSQPEGALIGSWMDGYRQDVFSALYRVIVQTDPHEGRIVEIESPSVGDPSQTLE